MLQLLLLAACPSFLAPSGSICSQRHSCAACVSAVPAGSMPCGWCANAELRLDDTSAGAPAGQCHAHTGRAEPAAFVCPRATRRWVGAGDPWHACPDAAAFEQPRAVWERVWSAGPAGLQVGEAFDAGRAAPVLDRYLLPLARQRWPAPRRARALVPGCGRGYEAGLLAAAFGEVEGWDVSRTAIAAAQAHAHTQDQAARGGSGSSSAGRGRVRFRARDFFDERTPVAAGRAVAAQRHPQRFDLVLDYTFLAVLPPSRRLLWAERVASLLQPGGELWTLIFPIFGATQQQQQQQQQRADQGQEELHADDDTHERELLRRGGPPFSMSMQLVRSVLAPVGLVPVELRMLGPGEAHLGRDGAGGAGASTALGRWKFKEEAAVRLAANIDNGNETSHDFYKEEL